ncbi:ATP-binding cassette domain-containing protein [Actinomadura rayongensis]|uniref:ATP-binding cassette domain-containing protein n=1 Tax=Actinomadura rayongensis TaxID=1429076 RepID=A0A6I4W537_9ACTN|nr:ATP-binding cassette domain-containing protein [Actinomadura rayongensis]
MTPLLEAWGLGRRYGRRWALAECTVRIPAGRVAGLVGANGAGKSTLLALAAGMLEPSAGTVRVLGDRPGSRLGKVAYVAQDAPLYAGLTVAEHLRLGARLNPRWDAASARARIDRLGLDPARRAGRLSGGQRAQLALTLGLAKRPELLILDESAAALDPLARRDFRATLLEAVAADGLSVLLASHLVADLERTCDHLVVLADGRVRVAGDIDDLLARHRRLTGPRRDPGTLPRGQHVVAAVHAARQSSLVVRTDDPILDPAWEVGDVGLEDLVIAYMSGEPVLRPAAGRAKAAWRA